MMETPILLIVFNRPDVTSLVFNRIRTMAPCTLYVVADGPRQDVEVDIAGCAEVRKIVTKVDWNCKVEYRFREGNVGFIRNITEGIDWILSQHDSAVILEDDCFPAVSFGRFCDELLELYENDSRIYMISGTNYLNCWSANGTSYHFSRFGGVWGWATWKRAWKNFRWKWKKEEIVTLREKVDTASPALPNRKFLLDLLERRRMIQVHSWDYDWLFTMIYNDGIAVVPEYNLVENIGFSKAATHTRHTNRHLDCLKPRELSFPLNMPSDISPDFEYDARMLKIIGFEKGGERCVLQKMKVVFGEDLPKWFNKKQWRDIEYYDDRWKQRIRQMAENIPADSTVLDLGAGEMFMKELIDPNRYFSVDYLKREPRTLVYDFNRYHFPPAKANVAVVSGCLEYIRDYRWFISMVGQCCRIAVVSYCTRDDFSDIRWRRKHAWRNHLRKHQLIDLFKMNGMILLKEESTPTKNTIFVFQHE